MRKLKFCPECGTRIKEDRLRERDKLVCPACGHTSHDNPIPAVAAIVLHKGNVLIVRSKEWGEAFWGLPGGYVKQGESLEDAAVREAREETSLSVRIVRLIGSYPIKRRDKNLIFIVFLAESLTDVVSPGSDVIEIAAFPPEETLKRLTGEIAKKAMAEWLTETT